MPTELYGDTQVREIKFTRAEMVSMVLQHLKQTMDRAYDFDYDRPIVIQGDDGGLILRYVQSTVAVDRESRQITFQSLEEVIKKKAERLKK
jgi:hypothetical protein